MAACVVYGNQFNVGGIKQLTSSNYTTWSRDMESLLRDSKLWHLIESESEKSNSESNNWKSKNKWAKELIKAHVDDSFIDCFHKLTNKKNAKQMWEALANHDFQQDYNGSEALQRATTTEEKSKALDKISNEMNSAPAEYANKMTTDVVQKITDIIDEENNPSSLKEKALQLFSDLVNSVPPDNIVKFLECAAKILAFYTAVPQSPQAQLCVGILYTVARTSGSILHLLRETDVKNCLALYMNLVSNVSPASLAAAVRAGWTGLAAFFRNQQMAIRVFDHLPSDMQKQFVDVSLALIKRASDRTTSVVSNCIAVLNKLKDISTIVYFALKQQTSAWLASLFQMMTNATEYAKECVKDTLEIMRSFGDETVGKYIVENRDSIDTNQLGTSYTYWTSFRDYLGDLLNWFSVIVLIELEKIVKGAVQFVQQNPELTAGVGAVTAGVIFTVCFPWAAAAIAVGGAIAASSNKK
uniref:DUF4219 domain-containing protein n=1 Tax=Cacopsylla melanoneura TaxID=428564 RepID=A0A8D8V2H6_9HEMI